MRQNQSNTFNNPNFPNDYYYPPYYYPNQHIQNPYQQPFTNQSQPLYYEVPNQYEEQFGANLQNTISPFVEYFQDDQGEVDIDKVIATTNQFMKTASQIAPMVKTLNDFVKGMKL
ncbi:YppG family protein [Piscibacillus salipiscarius]|uniref:YppG family protein n=1 Tax=Piscibacillus salipiscarius TaxID=299480 RepID=A0ABW5QD27_9BACI